VSPRERDTWPASKGPARRDYPALHFFASASQHVLGVAVGPLVGVASLPLAVLAVGGSLTRFLPPCR